VALLTFCGVEKGVFAQHFTGKNVKKWRSDFQNGRKLLQKTGRLAGTTTQKKRAARLSGKHGWRLPSLRGRRVANDVLGTSNICNHTARQLLSEQEQLRLRHSYNRKTQKK